MTRKLVRACERTKSIFSKKIELVRSHAQTHLQIFKQFSVPLSPDTNPGLNGKYPVENIWAENPEGS